jgi:hypothetical protein
VRKFNTLNVQGFSGQTKYFQQPETRVNHGRRALSQGWRFSKASGGTSEEGGHDCARSPEGDQRLQRPALRSKNKATRCEEE